MKRNILTIFLASPGDLEQERKSIRSIVDRVNKTLGRRVGWHVELLGWEDTLPSYNRPQALINKDVDSCDLFIGMLWKRWGQTTGKYSSGFEEEFERVKSRRAKEDKPEIWLLFKSIDEETTKDPGKQLKKVISFRETQISKKELYFKEFNEKNYKEMIYDDFISYIIELNQIESDKTHQIKEESEASKAALNKRETGDDDEQKSTTKDIIELFGRLNKSLSLSEKDGIDFWDKVRLFMTAFSWYSKAQSSEIIDNHEINLIFFKRNEWELSSDEQWLIFRSIISDENNLRPGWCWFKDYAEDKVVNLLNLLAINDSNINIRKNSISNLSQLKICPDEAVIKECLLDKEEVVLATLKLLSRVGEEKHLPLIEELCGQASSDIKGLARKAYIEIIYRQKPNEAFKILVENSWNITKSIKKSLENQDNQFDKKLLFKALSEADASVRKHTAKFLADSNKLSKGICHQILKDTDAQVRKIGLLKLIEIGEEISFDFCRKLFPEPKKGENALLGGLGRYGHIKADDFIPFIYQKRSPEKLLETIDFYSTNSAIAYRIIATHNFEFIQERIRTDLDEEFITLKNDSDLKLQNSYGDAAKALISNWKPSVIDFVKGNFIAAALDGLSVNGRPEDLKYARKYLNSKYSSAQEPAIALIEKYGDESDIEMLLVAAKGTYGENKKNVLRQIFRLSTNKEKLLDELINDDDKTLSKQAATFIKEIDPKPCIEKAKDILYHKNEDIRLIGLAVIIEQMTASELEAILQNYINADSYYYNVVSWLDQILYAPQHYSVICKEKLMKQITL